MSFLIPIVVLAFILLPLLLKKLAVNKAKRTGSDRFAGGFQRGGQFASGMGSGQGSFGSPDPNGGNEAYATVLEVREHGEVDSMNQEVELVLEVRPRFGQPYRATVRKTLFRLDRGKYAQGASVRVLVDPSDPSRVTLLDSSTASPSSFSTTTTTTSSSSSSQAFPSSTPSPFTTSPSTGLEGSPSGSEPEGDFVSPGNGYNIQKSHNLPGGGRIHYSVNSFSSTGGNFSNNFGQIDFSGVMGILNEVQGMMNSGAIDPSFAQSFSRLGAMMGDQRSYEELKTMGVRAEAILLSAVPANIYINGTNPVYTLTLEVHPEGGASFHSVAMTPIPTDDLRRYQPGARLSVLFDPHDRSRVVLDERRT